MFKFLLLCFVCALAYTQDELSAWLKPLVNSAAIARKVSQKLASSTTLYDPNQTPEAREEVEGMQKAYQRMLDMIKPDPETGDSGIWLNDILNYYSGWLERYTVNLGSLTTDQSQASFLQQMGELLQSQFIGRVCLRAATYEKSDLDICPKKSGL